MTERPRYQDPKKLHRYTDEKGEDHIAREKPVCDFCTHPDAPIKWSYPVGKMALPMNSLMSHTQDDWACCEDCHAYIERKDWDGLTEFIIRRQLDGWEEGRKLPALEKWPPKMRVEIFGAVRDHLTAFAAAQKGPPIPEGTFDPRTGEPLG